MSHWRSVLYNGLIHLLLPLVAWLSWRKCQKARAEQPLLLNCFAQKFGHLTGDFQTGGILIHAVSLGETRSILPLIERLQQQYPELAITLTNGSVRGAKQLATQLPKGIQYSFLPLDYPFALKRFLNTLNPSMVLIVETEIWPNLIQSCHQANIPMHFINARLKFSSMQKYQRFGGAWLTQLLNLTHIHCQFESDKQHFEQLGVHSSQLSIMGNLKFDLSIPSSVTEQSTHWKQAFGERFIWIAASTHEHEEAMMLAAHQQLRTTYPQALLIIVPRQADRFNEVENLLKSNNCIYTLRSQIANADITIANNTQVMLADSVGEMLLWMSICDAAFIGGSLVPFGGHNILEPAAFHKPVLSGPHFQNLQALFEVFLKDDSLLVVHSTDELAQQLQQIASSPSYQTLWGEKAYTTFSEQSGSLSRLLEQLKIQLNSNS